MNFNYYILIILFVSFIYSQENYFEYLSKDSIKKHIEILGSDEFEGRGTGQRGGSLAANYLAKQFNNYGLKKIGDNNSYFQLVPMHSNKPLKESELILYKENEDHKLELFNEYVLFKTGDQTFIPTPLEMIFVGYGIIAPEYDYNDYTELDIENKIAVVLDGEPISEDPNFFDANFNTVYSYHESKIRIAFSRGARGIIIIPNPLKDEYFKWENIKKQFDFDDISLAYFVSSILGVIINPVSAKVIFENSQFSFDDVLNMDLNGRIKSFPLTTKLSFNGSFKKRDFIANNVLGILEGSDSELKDEYIIVSAHYDHLGIGPAVNGDSIYNGVFDNAAGCAALLEISGAISSFTVKPKRSILFFLSTGEEYGLLGSTYYIDRPVVPLYKTVANINIDGLASFDEFNSIIGIGQKYSTLNDYLEKTAEESGLEVDEIPSIFESTEAFNRSDQIAFAKAGIPSILILDAPDYKSISTEEAINKIITYQQNIYHTPFDDLSLKINYDAALQHVEFLTRFIINIANSEDKPEWKDDSPYINERLRSRAEKR